MKSEISSCLSVALLAIAVGSPGAANAQSGYPTKPITLIVAAGAGSATDLVGRFYAEKLSAVLGQPIVVDNRSGASGVIGIGSVARSAPDCQTLLVANASALTLVPHMSKTPLPYDADKDIAPVSLLTMGPLTMSVADGSPVRTVTDLIEYSKKRPDSLKYGSDGVGTLTHLTGELLKQQTGINMIHVPFRGTADMLNALLSGNIDVALTGSGVIPLAGPGRARILAIFNSSRFVGLPDIPTVAESGVSNFIVTTWFGFFAPGTCNPEIVTRLSKEIATIATMPDLKARLTNLGQEAASSTPEELKSRIASESKKWGDFVKANHLEAP